jgi:hypothetical protein
MEIAPRQARASLLLARVLSGEVVDIRVVEQGIEDTFEAAKTQPWILTQSDAYQLRDWLRLLPFATPVRGLAAVVRKVPDAQRSPQLFEEMIRGLGYSPFGEAEDMLFEMAADDPRLYRNYQWRETVLRRATASSARRLVDLTVAGALSSNSADSFRWGSDLGQLVSEFPEVSAYVHGLLNSSAPIEHLAVLASALSHNPGADGVLALVDFEIRTGRSVWSWRSIEKVVTEHVPSESWKGAYNVVPVAAIELRKKLLAIAKAIGDPATRCLNAIDRIRDEYGAPEDEPRHPDLASGKHWPMLTPDTDAE